MVDVSVGGTAEETRTRTNDMPLQYCLENLTRRIWESYYIFNNCYFDFILCPESPGERTGGVTPYPPQARQAGRTE